jgi:hypothetical protein
MTFLNGITHLTNWMGNVIMPTVTAASLLVNPPAHLRGP